MKESATPAVSFAGAPAIQGRQAAGPADSDFDAVNAELHDKQAMNTNPQDWK